MSSSPQSMRHRGGGQKWTCTLSPRRRVYRDHTLDLSKALKHQGTETKSIRILKMRYGIRLTRTCRCRLFNRDNTTSIFHRQTHGWMWGWVVTEIISCKQRENMMPNERLRPMWERETWELRWRRPLPLSAAPCLWGRIQCKKGWDKNLQTETARQRHARCH